MKLRRVAMIAGGALVAGSVGAGIVAERAGVDLTLIVDKLIVQARAIAEFRPGKAPDATEHESAALEPAVKGDRLGDGDAGSITPPDAHEMKREKAAEAGHADAPSAEGSQARQETAKPEASHEPADGVAQKAGGGHGEKPAHEAKGGHGETQAEEAGGEDHAPVQGFDAAMHLLPPGENQPWRIFRRLQQAQDRIVVGEPRALQAYREEMARAAQEMMALPAPTWQSKRNVISAAAYVMAGGRPALAEHVLGFKETDAGTRELLEGALAYAKGDYYRAYNLLYHVEPGQLPVSVAGQVALVKAMLMSPRDINRAATFLAQARQLAPGTLVEEAALRRIIRIEAEAGDVDAFFEIAKAYARRFPKSVFLSDFLRNFAFGSLRLPYKHTERLSREIDLIAGRIDPDARIFMFSMLARGGTVFGKFGLAREASRRSLELVRDDPRLEQRLKLYLAASSLTDPDLFPEAKKQLDSFGKGLFGAEDERLLEAARTVADGIERPIDTKSLAMPDLPEVEPTASIDNKDTDPVMVSDVETRPLLPALKKSRSMLTLAEQAMDW